MMYISLLVVLCATGLSKSAERAEVVANGDTDTLPCSNADGQSYKWIFCRVVSFDRCQSPPSEVGVTGQSISITFYASSTTGVYSCVTVDENTVFDVYYRLSQEEWLYVFPTNLIVTPGSEPMLTFRFLQLPETLSAVEIKVFFRSLDGTREVPLSDVVHAEEFSDKGEASYTLNTTSLTNGSIIARGSFSVNGDTHTAESTIGLTFVDEELSTGPSTIGTAYLAGVIAVGVVVAVGLAIGLMLLSCYLIQRKRRRNAMRPQPPVQAEDELEQVVFPQDPEVAALVPDAQERAEPLVPEDRQVEPLVPQDRELEPLVPQDHEVGPLVPQDRDVEPLVPQDREAEPLVPQDHQAEPLIPQDRQAEPLVPQDHQAEPLVPQDREAEALVPQDSAVEDSHSLQEAVEETSRTHQKGNAVHRAPIEEEVAWDVRTTSHGVSVGAALTRSTLGSEVGAAVDPPVPVVNRSED